MDSGQPQVAETAVGWVSGAIPGPKKLTSSRGSGGTTKLARKTLTLEASNGVASGISERMLAMWTSTRTPPSREREDSLVENGYWMSHDTMGGPSTQQSGVCSESKVARKACLTSAIPYRLLEERMVIRPRLRRGEMRMSIQWPLTISGSRNVRDDWGSQYICGKGSFLDISIMKVLSELVLTAGPNNRSTDGGLKSLLQ